VNDRVDLALVLGADGAHLGERSLATGDARAVLGDGALLGRSVHGERGAEREREEVGRGGRRSVDFLLAGPVFETPSHPGRPGLGAAGLSAIVRAAGGIPVLGIGGVTADRIDEILRAGARGVAVVRSAWEREDTRGAIEELLHELPEN
jgi:thiamine-phosphate pyrophosphorylase